MNFKITLEWDYENGISINQMFPFIDGIENEFKQREYGSSIKIIWIVLTCRPYDFKQRKRYVKAQNRLEYEILLDFYLIKNLSLEEKKALTKFQFINITEETVKKYKFKDFNTEAFLTDTKQIVEGIQW